MRRADDVGRDGVDGLAVALADDRLRGEVEHHVGPARGPRATQGREVADVAVDVPNAIGDTRGREQVRLRDGRERIAGDIGAELRQPERQPPAFEAGVPGDEHALAAERVGPARDHFPRPSHTAHGDLPLDHISEIC